MNVAELNFHGRLLPLSCSTIDRANLDGGFSRIAKPSKRRWNGHAWFFSRSRQALWEKARPAHYLISKVCA